MTTTDETAPSPAISDAAVEAAAEASFNSAPYRSIDWSDLVAEAEEGTYQSFDVKEFRAAARRALKAALPHLTVPAPPPAPDRLIITTEMLDAVELALHQLYGNDAATGDGVTILHAAFKASTRPVPASRPPVAPPAPDGLDAFAAWFDGQQEVWVTDQHEDRGPMVRWIAAFRATRPAPAAPTETLDSVLAEIEAMGWDIAVRYPEGHRGDPVRRVRIDGGNGYDGLRAYGDSLLAAAIALCDAIAAAQQPQEGTEHGDH